MILPILLLLACPPGCHMHFACPDACPASCYPTESLVFVLTIPDADPCFTPDGKPAACFRSPGRHKVVARYTCVPHLIFESSFETRDLSRWSASIGHID